MTGQMEVQLPLKAGKVFFVSQKDRDVKMGGDFYMLLNPLGGIDGDNFYYVRLIGDGRAIIDGEGYLLKPEHLAEYKKDARQSFDPSSIRYYIVDSEYRTIAKLQDVKVSDQKKYLEERR